VKAPFLHSSSSPPHITILFFSEPLHFFYRGNKFNYDDGKNHPEGEEKIFLEAENLVEDME